MFLFQFRCRNHLHGIFLKFQYLPGILSSNSLSSSDRAGKMRAKRSF